MGKYATKEQLTALVADMASKINIASGTQGVSGSYVPIGCIEAFMGVEAPPDFLVCDGSLHSIASYPQLADHFYEQFGASNHFGGNGTTTFAVPDLRGEFLRGTGANGHENQGSGANVGEHQDGTKHVDVLTENNKLFVRQSTTSDIVVNGDNYDGSTTWIGYSNPSTGALSSANDGMFTSRPTNTSVLWCIKAIDEKIQPGGGGIDYSTEEQDTGLKWIDGRSIYQRTWELPSELEMSGNTWYESPLPKSEGSFVISAFGVSYSEGGCMPLMAIKTGSNSNIMIMHNRTNIGMTMKYLTMQYTKTT